LWRLFQRYAAIFATLRGKDIELSFSLESLNNITGIFSPAFAALAAIAPLVRATRLLTPAELDHLVWKRTALHWARFGESTSRRHTE
jgi:hypothetical protein